MFKKETKYQEVLKYTQASIMFKLGEAYSVSTCLGFTYNARVITPRFKTMPNNSVQLLF